MKVVSSLLVFVLMFTCASSQLNVDSLKKELAIAKEDTNKAKILLRLCSYYQWRIPDSSILYAMQGIPLAEKLNFEKAQLGMYGCMGEALSGKGNFSLSLETKLKSLKLAEKTGDERTIAWAYAGIGTVYFYSHDYKNALTYFIKTKNFPKAFHQSEKNFTGFIGETYFHLTQLDSAFKYIKRAYELDQLDPQWSVPYYYMAKIYAKRNDYAKAIDFYRTGLNLRVPSLDLINGNKGIAEIFKNIRLFDSAVYYARKALVIAQGQSFENEVIEASSILKDVYKEMNFTDSAFKYQELMLAAKDSVYGQEKVKQMQNLSFNEQLRQQELLAQQQQYQNKVKTYVLIATVIVFVIIALILWRNNRYKQRAFDLLRKQKQQTEQEGRKAEKALEVLQATQSQLIQSEKMASLGELTAGIAHEIQNPLNFVNNFAEINTELIEELKSELQADNKKEALAIADNIKENQQKINDHGKRADAIVKGMLQHSRANTGKKEPTDINALAEEYLRLSYHGLRAKDIAFDANFTTDFDETIDKIEVTPQDIGRVLLNLYNNAFYSVSEKKAQLNGIFQPLVSVTTKRTNGKIEISVKDNGTGIPQKALDKIYQPFFTTKPTGQGTGLGLSMSYDIIKVHSGELKVKTIEGEGAEFTIQLPLSGI
ncbi:MAG: multi-sensor signal transduction histidine kinase [Segetibacter sp.]|nr:multi-sensor signal transduction histidine kinase [Segetibacter sp.]